jgi:hypothetical protein
MRVKKGMWQWGFPYTLTSKFSLQFPIYLTKLQA